jgi:hypothetical protein
VAFGEIIRQTPFPNVGEAKKWKYEYAFHKLMWAFAIFYANFDCNLQVHSRNAHAGRISIKTACNRHIENKVIVKQLIHIHRLFT